jgi:hypothetical protein
MLEQAIAEFYRVVDENGVTVYVRGDEYFIGDLDSLAFCQEEIEWAAITTTLPVHYVEV